MNTSMTLKQVWTVECRDKDGNLKWSDGFENLVTNVGLDDILAKYLRGSAYTAAWYMGLIDNSGFSALAAGDTLASHAGWTEFTTYTGNRQAVTFANTGTGQEDNSGAVNAFAITGTATLKGAFLCTAASGTSGVLYAEGTFSATRDVVASDTLNVTVTITQTSA